MRRFVSSPLLACIVLLSACALQLGDGGTTFVLSFKNLSGALLPTAVEPDANGKDVVIATKAAFKPSKGSEIGLNKRLRLKSKVDGGAAVMATEVQMHGNVTARLRLAITSTVGLADDTTLGFLERRAAGRGPVQRLEAVWNAGLDGFTLRAVDDGTPTGTTLDLPGAREVVLSIEDAGASFELHGGEPVGESLMLLSPEAELATLAQAPDTETAAFAFGAEGLGKKGTLYLGQFTLEFGADIGAGESETEIGTALVMAWQSLDAAQDLLDQDASGPGAVQSMYVLLDDAANHLGFGPSGATGLAQAAVAGGSFDPWTQGEDAAKNILTALGWVFPASQDMFEELQDGGSNIQKVQSHVTVGLKRTELAIAQLAGFKSNSHGKLEKVMDFDLK